METENYLNKAANSLKAAQLCFDNGLYDDAVSRAYYCVLKAAIAILVAFGHSAETQKKHQWVRAIFPRELMKRKKILPRELMTYFTDLQNERESADYEPKLISDKTAERAIKKAQKFLSLIQKVYYAQIGKN